MTSLLLYPRIGAVQISKLGLTGILEHARVTKDWNTSHELQSCGLDAY
jgi:hypothetical protein